MSAMCKWESTSAKPRTVERIERLGRVLVHIDATHALDTHQLEQQPRVIGAQRVTLAKQIHALL